jgi:hypothetical protein
VCVSNRATIEVCGTKMNVEAPTASVDASGPLRPGEFTDAVVFEAERDPIAADVRALGSRHRRRRLARGAA